MIKLVDSLVYHIWTDALHGRELARQTTNAMNRGTYVRWAIMSAWAAFESACADALDAHGLGNDFRRNFDKAVVAKGLPAVIWGNGTWQRVMKV